MIKFPNFKCFFYLIEALNDEDIRRSREYFLKTKDQDVPALINIFKDQDQELTNDILNSFKEITKELPIGTDPKNLVQAWKQALFANKYKYYQKLQNKELQSQQNNGGTQTLAKQKRSRYLSSQEVQQLHLHKYHSDVWTGSASIAPKHYKYIFNDKKINKRGTNFSFNALNPENDYEFVD